MISIVIPLFRAEKYIGRCLDSLLKQTLQDFEVLVVNDFSPDNSRLVVLEYSAKDSRIKLLENEQNRGPMATRHVGSLAAAGDYITYIDSDDWLPEDALEKLYNNAIDTGADIVCGTIERTNGEGEFYGKMTCCLPYGDDKIGFFKGILDRNVTQNLCSKLFKRELLQNYPYIIVEHCVQAEDAAVLFQCGEHISKVSAIDDVVYCYYDNAASVVRSTSLHAMECICKMTIVRENILRKNPELDEYRNKYFTENLSKSKVFKEENKMLYKYGLQQYMSWSYIFRYLSSEKRNKYIVKYVLHKLRLRKFQ